MTVRPREKIRKKYGEKRDGWREVKVQTICKDVRFFEIKED